MGHVMPLGPHWVPIGSRPFLLPLVADPRPVAFSCRLYTTAMSQMPNSPATVDTPAIATPVEHRYNFPTLHTPYDQPDRYWLTGRGASTDVPPVGKRRPPEANPLETASRTPSPTSAEPGLFGGSDEHDCSLIQTIRGEVAAWRAAGYPRCDHEHQRAARLLEREDGRFAAPALLRAARGGRDGGP